MYSVFAKTVLNLNHKRSEARDFVVLRQQELASAQAYEAATAEHCHHFFKRVVRYKLTGDQPVKRQLYEDLLAEYQEKHQKAKESVTEAKVNLAEAMVHEDKMCAVVINSDW